MAVDVSEAPLPSGAARTRSIRWGLLLGVLAAAIAAALLFYYRPEGQIFYPRCLFHSVTGWLCPGCGGLRAGHELLHGRWLQATRCNALFVLGLPVAVAWWIWNRFRRQPLLVTPRMIWLAFALTVVFTLLRNIPGALHACLAP